MNDNPNKNSSCVTPKYVQYGCGFSVGKDWLNFDSSPTLRVESVPIVGRLLGRLAGNSQPFPRLARYGDVCKGLPVVDSSIRGVYASHVLEHLAYHDCLRAIRNTFRILEPGGIFRLIVPDLQERARRYLEEVSRGSPDASANFMKMAHLGLECRPRTLIGVFRQVYGGSAHLWMWDEPSLVKQLKEVGFTEIRRCKLGDSNDPMFKQVEDPRRFHDMEHNMTELAIQARKPMRR